MAVVIENVTEQLQRHILERQRRPVEQFQHPMPFAELAQGCDRGRIERGIGLLEQPVEIARA